MTTRSAAMRRIGQLLPGPTLAAAAGPALAVAAGPATRVASVAGRVRRTAGRARRATAARARLLGYLLRLRGRSARVAVLVSGRNTGTVTAAVRVARSAHALRVPVTLLVLEFPPAGEAEDWLAALPSGVRLRRFYHGDPAPAATEGSTPAGDHVRCERDATGALARAVDTHPDTGAEVTHRYLRPDGRCWLSVWLAGGVPRRVLRHEPSPREYRDLRAAQADWVREQLRLAGEPAVLAAGKVARAVAGKLDAPFGILTAKRLLTRYP